MNFNKNYYLILNINKDCDEKDIKKSYYKLSFKYHPDTSKNDDITIFNEIKEAYDTLSNKLSRDEYDRKSKFGRNYSEFEELFNVNIDINYDLENNKYEEFKKNSVLNIVENINKEDFSGSIEYKRWVICKDCKGTGMDSKSKMVIKDENGNIKAIFESDDGCDFCEGTGNGPHGIKCGFCFGQGKVGTSPCSGCKGEKRTLGKQRLSNISIDINSNEFIIKHMGHFSKTEPGKVGDLILKY